MNILEIENLVPLAKAYNVNYNRETGYFEYAGLTDLTADDVRNMIAETSMYTCGEDIDWKYAYCNSRVNLLPSYKRDSVFTAYYKSVSAARAFYYAKFEVIQLCSNYKDKTFGFVVSDTETMFGSCQYLRKIEGNLIMNNVDRVVSMFNKCWNLADLKMVGLGKSISFADSPRLTYVSLKFLVDNAANTEAITVTVHADVYAKLSGTASEYGDHTQEEWTAIMTAATEKQISFATV